MRIRRLAAVVLCGSFALIFVPAIGHGFIKDDFVWIGESQVTSARDVGAFFGRNVGFYRPLVSASFALDEHIWGLDPFGYGLTNLLVFVIDALLLLCLARRLSLSRSAAGLAVAAWAFNVQGVNMALLWISGRTALMMGMFALAAALAALDRRWRVAGLLTFLAMLCKEEAVLMPFLFLLFESTSRGRQESSGALRTPVLQLWPMWLALALYLVLRQQSGAFGPHNAPAFYAFTFAPLDVAENVLEYVNRGASFAAGLTLVLLVCGGTRTLTLTLGERRAIRFGLIWFVCFYAITVFLPVRSSLYALIPSVGSAVAFAAAGSAVERVSARRFEFYCAAMALAAACLIPIYRQHNERWILPADLSTQVMHDLRLATTGHSGGRIVLVDDPSAEVRLDSSFGGLFPEAVRLMLGRTWDGEIQPNMSEMTSPVVEPRFIFALRNGKLRPVARDGAD